MNNLRMIIAVVCALSIHFVLFSLNFGLPSKNNRTLPSTHVIQMTFSSSKKESVEPKTDEEKIIRKKTTQKPILSENSSDRKNEDSDDSESPESVSVVHKAQPLTISNKPPSYPRIAQLRGYQGTVILRVLVNTNGTVSKLNVFKSSGYWILDKAALEAVQGWKFQPGTDGLKKVVMWVEQPIRFQLK